MFIILLVATKIYWRWIKMLCRFCW